MSYLAMYAEFLDPQLSILGRGHKIVPINYLINFQKGGTLFAMLSLMVYFNNFSLGAWVYLALHGSYGVIWFTKDMIFPDKSFQQRVNLIVFVVTIFILLSYWGIGFLMMSGIANNNPSPERIFCCIFIYVIGVSLMLLTDLQKYITLKYKKGTLLDDYFISNNRNTNFLGEMLLYSSFAVLVNHRLACYILIFVWSTVFFSRIYLKERSLSKKEGYSRYQNNSYLLLFKFFNSDLINFLLYISLIVGSYYIFSHGGFESTIKYYF